MSLPESDKIIPFERLEQKRAKRKMPSREMVLLDNLARDLIFAPPPFRQEDLQGRAVLDWRTDPRKGLKRYFLLFSKFKIKINIEAHFHWSRSILIGRHL